MFFGVLTGMVSLIAGIKKLFFTEKQQASPQKETPASVVNTNTSAANVTVNVGSNLVNEVDKNKQLNSQELSANLAQGRRDKILRAKQLVRILFIDDDTDFRYVEILQAMGWIHTKTVTDVASLTAPEVVEAHIIFVDIKGVGIAMKFSQEGLGLASAIKREYQDSKKVVIYSAQRVGLHAAFKEADGVLPKNAEPIQFEQLIEEFIPNNI